MQWTRYRRRGSNVNGKIELTAAHVAGGIRTVAGDIAIRGPSHVEGGILVEKNTQLIHFGSSVPRVPFTGDTAPAG